MHLYTSITFVLILQLLFHMPLVTLLFFTDILFSTASFISVAFELSFNSTCVDVVSHSVLLLLSLKCVFKCTCIFPFSVNPLLQPWYGHLKGFSSKCVYEWIFNVDEREYFPPQIEHSNGLIFECIFIWSIKCPLALKRFLHPSYEHTYGFSPVCIRMWVFKLPFSLKLFEQPGYGHINGFSPVYIYTYIINNNVIIYYMRAIMYFQPGDTTITLVAIWERTFTFSNP